MRFVLAFLLAITMAATVAMPARALTLDPENTIHLQLKYGTVIIRLRPDLAPLHVERIKKLTREGFYNGLKFHRVIEGFMAQTGDPTGTGFHGSTYGNIAAEFNHMPFVRGTIGMARSTDPNSANSQWFICFGDAQFLNRQYTAWGEVVEGMEFVDKLVRGEPPATPDTIIKMTVAADLPPASE